MGSMLGMEDPWRTKEIQTLSSWIDTLGARSGGGGYTCHLPNRQGGAHDSTGVQHASVNSDANALCSADIYLCGLLICWSLRKG